MRNRDVAKRRCRGIHTTKPGNVIDLLGFQEESTNFILAFVLPACVEYLCAIAFVRRPVMLKSLFFQASIALLSGLMISPTAKPVLAQEVPSPDPNIETTKLQSFARVYVEFEKIRETYLPRLKTAQSVQETDDIQKEARLRIDETLKREGMTPESYSQIINRLNNDGELRAKALQLIDEERKKS